MTWWDGGIDLAPFGGSAPQPNAGVYINNSSAEIYDAYSATWTAVTGITRTYLSVGNGTEVCRWFSVGGRAHVMYSLTFGTTTALDATEHPTVEVTDFTAYALLTSGPAAAYDSSSGRWYPIALYGTGTNAETRLYANATYPFTFTTGDVLSGTWTLNKLPPDFTIGES